MPRLVLALAVLSLAAPVAPADVSGTRSAQTANGFANTVPTRWMLTLGDSKTAFHDAQYGHWQDTLITALSATSGGPWVYVNRGVGSQTVASYLAIMQSGATLGAPFCAGVPVLIDSICIPPTWAPPAAVLINLGINDSFLNVITTQATWQTNYLAIIDLVRARWPTAPIYVMRWWATGFAGSGAGAAADADTMDAWVPAMIALRANVYLGPDERVWLKGADNGVTNCYDGIHQNSAGIVATAAAWKAVLQP